MDAHSDDDLWFVQLSDGGVRAYSLDELDTAFQTGSIDEATLVRQDGSLEWTPLGVVLSGGDEAPAPVAEMAPASAAPPSVPPPSAAPPPVVAELGVDDDVAPSFGRSKKRVAFAAIAAVAVLGAAAFTAVRVGGAADPSKVTASMPVTVTQASTPTTTTAGGDSIFGDAGPRLNDEQRRMLLDLDKKHDAEMQQRRANRPAPAAPSRPIKMGDGIQKGGSKYDPLNAAL